MNKVNNVLRTTIMAKIMWTLIVAVNQTITVHAHCHLCNPAPPSLHCTMMVVTLYFTNDFTQPIYKFLTLNGGGGGGCLLLPLLLLGKPGVSIYARAV